VAVGGTKRLKHGLFYGSYDLNLDPKHRLLVPSEVRRSINIERDGESFFVIVGTNKKPWLYVEKYYQEMAEQPADMLPSEDELAFNQLFYGMATRLILDTQGRILLPDKILKKTGIEKEITLVGNKEHLEIWNRTDWAVRETDLELQREEIVRRMKQVRVEQSALPRE
jgi:MraZ protein